MRQTLRRLDPALTVLVHMPPAPDVNVRRGGGNNGAPHAFLTSPSISQSCAPLTFAARRAQIGLHVSLPDARRQGGGVFRARVGPALDADYPCPPPGECKPAPSHPAAPRVTSRAHLANAVLRRPAEAQGPRCARAGRRVSGRGPSLSTKLPGSTVLSWAGLCLGACHDAPLRPPPRENGILRKPVLGRRARVASV